MGEGDLKEARGFWFAYKGIAFIAPVMVLAIRIWPEREKEGLSLKRARERGGEMVSILDRLKERLLSMEDSATTRENEPAKWSRTQGIILAFYSRNAPILCLLLTVANMITSVAASPAQTPQKQNESWAAIAGVAVAMAGVALAIVSATWWRKQRVSDLEGQHPGEDILDLTQVLQTNSFLPNLSRINGRRFEDMLPQAVPE